MLQIFRGKVSNVADLPGGRSAMLQTFRGEVCKREGLQYNTGTLEDVLNLLAIRGPTCGKGGLEPRSPVPQSSQLPLNRRGPKMFKKQVFTSAGKFDPEMVILNTLYPHVRCIHYLLTWRITILTLQMLLFWKLQTQKIHTI